MSLNLCPSPNLAERSREAQKPSGGAAACVCSHTRVLTQRLLPGQTRQSREQLRPVSPTLALLSVLFSTWVHLVVKENLHSIGWGPGLGTEVISF